MVMSQPSATPEVVVQRQLDAYNARNLEALLAIYADDAQMFEHPSRLLASGTAGLRERFAARFKEPNLQAVLERRIVCGTFVIDHERITRTFPGEGPGEVQAVMIYEVAGDRIVRAWMIPGPRQLHAATAQA